MSEAKKITLSAEQLTQLKDLKDDADFHRCAMDAAQSQVNLIVAQAAREARLSLPMAAVCFNCGTVRDNRIQACPDCSNQQA